MPSIKLSITVRGRLEKKYSTRDMKKIVAATNKWIAADSKRGIRNILAFIDDSASMKALGVKPISGSVTAPKVKTIIDALWKKLAPDYLVILGGDDIVPYFEVDNPSYQPRGDDDETVLTDNPYACTRPYRRGSLSSYLVADRVIGRVLDMPGDGDAEWLLRQLAIATSWTPQSKDTYRDAYAICCDTWKGAGQKCVSYLGVDAGQLMISPPNVDATKLPQSRLGSRLHVIKCHGSPIDPKFYGQKGESDYPVALTSKTLRRHLKPSTIAAAMCCYGAQTFAPDDPASQDPGEWPIAGAYLRGGAFGFVGATRIAWVGDSEMACADWIVSKYLRSILDGASQGRAFLESKQDYLRRLQQNGEPLGREDEKTLIEYLLLGDPSIQPVASHVGPVRASRAAAPPVEEFAAQRRQRRVYRAVLATQMRESLHERIPDKPRDKHAKALYKAAVALLGLDKTAAMPRTKDVQVDRLKSEVSNPQLKAAGLPHAVVARSRPLGLPRLAQSQETYQYYFCRRHESKGHKHVTMVRVESNAKGKMLRARVVHSS